MPSLVVHIPVPLQHLHMHHCIILLRTGPKRPPGAIDLPTDPLQAQSQ